MKCPELEPDEGDGTHFFRDYGDGTRRCEWCLSVEVNTDILDKECKVG